MNYSQKQAMNLLKKCQDDPVFFMEEVIGQPLWWKQKEIAYSVRDYSHTVVKSGHGVGKTNIAAKIVLWFLTCFRPSKVITTAPTWLQVQSILWSEINKLHAQSKYPLGGDMLQTALKYGVEHFAMGFSTDESDKFQGHHSPHILVLFDEAAGVKPDIWETAEGLMTSSHARMLAIGNPTAPHGMFYEAFKKQGWNKIHISCTDSPNYQEDKILIPGLVTRQWVEERKAEWGDDSPIFKARVLGEFPVEGEDTLIPLTWVEKAIGRDIILMKDDMITLGVDVARFGDDSTVFTILHGKRVIHQEAFNGKDTMKTVGNAVILFKKFNCAKIGVDDTGVGGGVVDRLIEENYPVIRVNFGSSARDKEKFADLKTEIFWNLREDFEHEHISIPNSHFLLEQLPSLMYEMTSRGQLHIVGKDKMKKMGMKSPDYADSLVIAHYTQYASKDAILDYYSEEVHNVKPVIQPFSAFLDPAALQNVGQSNVG